MVPHVNGYTMVNVINLRGFSQLSEHLRDVIAGTLEAMDGFQELQDGLMRFLK